LHHSFILFCQPLGGVKSGQTLRVPLLDEQCMQHKGKWKDGLCSCFQLGIFHPHLCNAWLCPQVLLGQILMRMKMTWLASPAANKSTLRSTFRKILVCMVVFSLYDVLMTPPLIEFNVDEKGDLQFQKNIEFPIWHQVFYVLLSLPMAIYGFFVLVKLRAAIRAKYGIPAGQLGRLEDFCCVCCCNCCVISQMARQTANYDEEPAAYFSPNGMRRPPVYTVEDEALCPPLPA
jgi:Cys-rich protein (TIGR01571 family)